MEPLERRSLLYFVVILSIYDARVIYQCLSTNGSVLTKTSPLNVRGESSTGSPTPTLMNSLLTIAAAKGVLPNILPALKTVVPENLQINTTDTFQEVSSVIAPVNTTVVPKKILVPNNPTKTKTRYPKVMMPLRKPSLEAIPRTIAPNVVPPGYPQVIPPSVTLQNRPFVNDFHSRTLTSPQQAVNRVNFNVRPSENTSNINSMSPITTDLITQPRAIFNSTNIGSSFSNGPAQLYPFDRQYNVPNLQAPRIVMIPTVPPYTCPSFSPRPPSVPQFIPSPPIFIQNSRSRFRNWLPIILFSMINDDDTEDCCCCNNNGRYIPVPYPIPIQLIDTSD